MSKEYPILTTWKKIAIALNPFGPSSWADEVNKFDESALLEQNAEGLPRVSRIEVTMLRVIDAVKLLALTATEAIALNHHDPVITVGAALTYAIIHGGECRYWALPMTSRPLHHHGSGSRKN